MDLSVIIPHYNLNPELLTRAIDSVVKQWDEDNVEWEIIVVDDGSDVPPEAVIRSFNHSNIQLYCREHARQGAARNFGLAKARGKYILFLDADDYIFANTLAPVLKLALLNDFDILRFETKRVYGKSIALTDSCRPSCSQPTTGEAFMRKNNLNDSPYSFLFRRNLAIDHNILFPENVFLEDCLFTARLHHFAQSLSTVNATVYAYYQRPDSTVNKSSEKHKELLRQHHLMAIDQLSSFINSEKGHCDCSGLRRKLQFLVVDYLRRICRDLNLNDITQHQIPLLRSRSLFPLPLRYDYGIKYYAFAFLANRRPGLDLLHLMSRCNII